MSETKDAVDRLRWLCEEAVCRVVEETEEDFTIGLKGLAEEVRRLCRCLQTAGIIRAENGTSAPYRLKWGEDGLRGTDLPFEFDYDGFSYHKPLKRLANGELACYWCAIWTVDPLSPSDTLGIFVVCQSVVETKKNHDDYYNEAGKTAKDFDTRTEYKRWTGTDFSFNPLTREQYRDLFIKYLRRWTRFLDLESAKLQTSPSAEKAKGKPGRKRAISPFSVRKTIRDMRAKGRDVLDIKSWLKEQKGIEVSEPTIYAELSKED
jgi:hypothetical protein